MKHHTLASLAGLALASLGLLALSARADTVTLKNGSVIHGKVVQVAGGTITVSTDFAGDLAIKQDQVVSLETDEPMFLKTQDNTTMLSKIEKKDSGLVLTGATGSYQTTVAGIKSSWAKDAEDPEIVALRPKWSLEIAADVAGKSGNSTGFASTAGMVAVRKTPTDALKFYASGAHAVANGSRSEDMYKGGAEYNSFFTSDLSWYVSSELMQDNVKDIALRVSTSGGLGINAIRKATQDLQFRVGLSYRYETYNTVPATPNFSSAGASFALIHRADLAPWAVMRNTITYVPSFKDTANYVIDHDSNFTLPFGGSKTWSLRFGVTNEYVSIPAGQAERLDTTYYLRLVLNML
jgi:hypothetical protein